MLSGSHSEISAGLKCMHYYLSSLLLFRIHLLLLLLVLLIFNWYIGIFNIIIVIIIIIIIIIIIYTIITELTYSKTILEKTVIEPQPVALDFKNLSQYSSRSKKNCLLKLCCFCCNSNLLQSVTKLFGSSTSRAYN